MTALLAENVQVNHASIAAFVTPFNPALRTPAAEQAISPFTAAGRGSLDAMVTAQATMIGYMDDFKLLMLTCLAVMPLVFLLRRSAGPVAADHSAVME